MNLLLSEKHQYQTTESVDVIISKIKEACTRSDYNFINNIKGQIDNKNRFKLFQRWALGFPAITPFGNKPAYLKGNVTAIDGQTIINIEIRPNFLFIGIIYFLVCFSLWVLFDKDSIIQGPKGLVFISLLTPSAILLGFVKYWQVNLKKSFEKYLKLTK